MYHPFSSMRWEERERNLNFDQKKKMKKRKKKEEESREQNKSYKWNDYKFDFIFFNDPEWLLNSILLGKNWVTW